MENIVLAFFKQTNNLLSFEKLYQFHVINAIIKKNHKCNSTYVLSTIWL